MTILLEIGKPSCNNRFCFSTICWFNLAKLSYPLWLLWLLLWVGFPSRKPFIIIDCNDKGDEVDNDDDDDDDGDDGVDDGDEEEGEEEGEEERRIGVDWQVPHTAPTQ